jgi:hypothetical protein
VEVNADVNQSRSFGLRSLAHASMVRGDAYGPSAVRSGTVVVQVEDRHVAASDRSGKVLTMSNPQLDIGLAAKAADDASRSRWQVLRAEDLVDGTYVKRFRQIESDGAK